MTLLAFVVFTIACEHGGRFLSSAMLLPCMHRPWQVPTLCLHCTRNVVWLAWCSVQKLFRMTWFLLPLFLVVPVVVRPDLVYCG